MSEPFKVAGPTGEPSATALLLHGLGGHSYDTWRRGDYRTPWDCDETFWPRWLERDCPTLAVHVIGHAAAVSRWRGTAMHLTDQATNILARLLAEPAFARGPLIFIGHSLGGLIIKQLLRTAASMAHYDPRAAELIRRVERVAFLATPHAGSGLARWGDRLRILARPSAATASLVRNDSNLRDLNNWYRDWANARGIVHLILAETRPTRILGTIVPIDSADPGLVNVRSIPIDTDHSGICKPVAPTQDIYVLVRDFVMRSAIPAQPLSDAIAEKVVAALDAREAARAEAAGIERHAIFELARRLKPDDVLDFEQAVKELTAAVEVAIEISETGARGSNLSDLADAVLGRIAKRNREGDLEGGAREVDQALAAWEREQAEHRAAFARSGIALLEAGLRQDILRRDARAAAQRVARMVALENPDDVSARFAAMVERHATFRVRGSNKGVNFDLLIAIDIARIAFDLAQDAQQRGKALNNLGTALRALGARESGTARLEEAVAAFRAALTEMTRERVPLAWAMTQNNLGRALHSLGERESGTTRLEEAVAAFRAALTERTRERVPLEWAMTQNNLGAVLHALGERESGTARLEEAVVAYRAALTERTRERDPLDWATSQGNLAYALMRLGERENGTTRLEEAVASFRAALIETTREHLPLDWATGQNNLGNALWALGERETGTTRLEEAVAAYHAALTERTRERVPLDWASTQNNLGNVLGRLGERESNLTWFEEAVAAYRAALSERTRERVPLEWAMTQNNLGAVLQALGMRETGTARLEEAVAAYRAALSERTRERVPLQWAVSTANLGFALLALAARTSDTEMARTAIAQVELALATMREGSHAFNLFAEKLSKVRTLVEELNKR
jgi:tetratricopeptide (TPR) repeat protein